MTDTIDALSVLRVAHGQLVATLLADLGRSAPDDSAALVTQLVRHNRLAAAQLRPVHARRSQLSIDQSLSMRAQPVDLAPLLAELAASCAELGTVVREVPPGVAWEQIESTLGSVIGHYRTATTLLHGGARA